MPASQEDGPCTIFWGGAFFIWNIKNIVSLVRRKLMKKKTTQTAQIVKVVFWGHISGTWSKASVRQGKNNEALLINDESEGLEGTTSNKPNSVFLYFFHAVASYLERTEKNFYLFRSRTPQGECIQYACWQARLCTWHRGSNTYLQKPSLEKRKEEKMNLLGNPMCRHADENARRLLLSWKVQREVGRGIGVYVWAKSPSEVSTCVVLVLNVAGCGCWGVFFSFRHHFAFSREKLVSFQPFCPLRDATPSIGVTLYDVHHSHQAICFLKTR